RRALPLPVHAPASGGTGVAALRPLTHEPRIFTQHRRPAAAAGHLAKHRGCLRPRLVRLPDAGRGRLQPLSGAGQRAEGAAKRIAMARPSRETLLALGLLLLLTIVTVLAAVAESREQADLPDLATFSSQPEGARA